MNQDPKVKLLHDFLQIADNIPPQVFLAHTAMLAVKEAQTQVSIQVQTLRDQHAAKLEQQQRDHEQRLSEHQTQHQQLLAEHAALQGQLVQQQLELQQAKAHPEQNAVWIDPKTGLMWSRISIGQRWKDGQPVGTATKVSWDDAQKACKHFWLAGFDDWRLPTKEELETITKEGEAGYNAPEGVLFTPDLIQTGRFGRYWSASPSADGNNNAWGVYFNSGNTSLNRKYAGSHVRAVRSIK